MHLPVVFLTLLTFASAAPSNRGHTLAHERRERFLRNHMNKVDGHIDSRAVEHKAIAQDKHERPQNYHAPHQAMHHISNPMSDEEEDCLIHQPFLKAHRKPTQRANLLNASNVDYSGNWCGIVQESAAANSTNTNGGIPFTAVSASWTMPQLSAPNSMSTGSDSPTTFYGSQWVGIDGYTYGGAILQAGTTSAVTVDANGNAVNSASAWFEWYPNPETPISEADMEVSPGDEIWCEVRAINTTAGTVTLVNMSTGQKFTTVFTAPSNDASLQGVNAEWIYEDFSAGGLVPFASFTPVTFENCTAETAGGEMMGVQGGTVVDLVDGNDVVCNAAVVDGTSLKVAYATGMQAQQPEEEEDEERCD